MCRVGVRFSEVEVDQARDAGVVIEFERYAEWCGLGAAVSAGLDEGASMPGAAGRLRAQPCRRVARTRSIVPPG